LKEEDCINYRLGEVSKYFSILNVFFTRLRKIIVWTVPNARLYFSDKIYCDSNCVLFFRRSLYSFRIKNVRIAFSSIIPIEWKSLNFSSVIISNIWISLAAAYLFRFNFLLTLKSFDREKLYQTIELNNARCLCFVFLCYHKFIKFMRIEKNHFFVCLFRVWMKNEKSKVKSIYEIKLYPPSSITHIEILPIILFQLIIHNS